MLASVVNFFNPSHVFIGGGITRIGPLFLAAVRQSVYQRSLALSTRHLEIQYTPLGAQGGVVVDFHAILTPVFHPILTPPVGV